MSVDAAVTVAGVTITPGDTIVVDASGCVRVQAADRDEVLAAARRYTAAEDEVLAVRAKGDRLRDAYLRKKAVVDQLTRERP